MNKIGAVNECDPGSQDQVSFYSSRTSNDEAAGDIDIVEIPPESPEVLKVRYSDEDLSQLIKYVQGMTLLFLLDQRDWTEEASEVITRWFLDVNEPIMTIFYDRQALTVCVGYPHAPVFDFCYFIRGPRHVFTPNGFHDEVHIGNIHEDVDGILLKKLQLVYAPIFRNCSEWNDTVKRRFNKAIEKFVSFLSGFHSKMAGMTVLYVPHVPKQVCIEDMAHDAALVHRLESIVVLWTTQIRTLLNDKLLVSPNDLMGPIEEYEFWMYRWEVLMGLNIQLNHEGTQLVINVLRSADLVYVQQVDQLMRETQSELEEAKSNIKFLHLLVEPCTRMNQAESPATVPAAIPRIIHLIRFIWLQSKHYNSRDRITELLRKLSNQIIKVCIEQINVDRILAGNPRFGIKMCNMSIDCCLAYKLIYERLSQQHAQSKPDFGWDLEKVMIFNHVDAFIERVRDLTDICEAMIVLGRLDETQEIPKPIFGGLNGKEEEHTADRVEKHFLAALAALKSDCKDLILNVFKTKWYEDMIKYRRLIESLEEELTRLMCNVFQRSCNIEEGLEALNVMLFYSYRPTLRKTYLRLVSKLWLMLMDEIDNTAKMFVLRSKVHESWIPHTASRAINYRINVERLQWLRDRLHAAEWLPSVPEEKKSLDKFDVFKQDCEKEIQKGFVDWANSYSSTSLQQQLERTLLKRSKVERRKLECNMDPAVFDYCEEARHFKHLGFEIPAKIQNIYAKYDALKAIYNSVVTICVNYNRISSVLSDEERQLFQALIRSCDRRMAPALYQLTWTDEKSAAFIDECIKHISELQHSVDTYKTGNRGIANCCEKICDTPVLKITDPCAVSLPVFKASLDAFSFKAANLLTGYHDNILNLLSVVYEEFQSVIDEMSAEWYKYVKRFDAMICIAMLNCARTSLLNIYNSVSSKDNAAPVPILLMRANIQHRNIVLTPKKHLIDEELKVMLDRVITVFDRFERMGQRLKLSPELLGEFSFSEILRNDVECREIQSAISTELATKNYEIDLFIKDWNVFRNIWEQTEVEFVNDVHFAGQNSEAFQQNIELYSSLADDVSRRESITSACFILINANSMKDTIIDCIQNWQRLNIKLLQRRTTEKIKGVYSYIKEQGERLAIVPCNSKQAKDALLLRTQLLADIPRKRQEIQGIMRFFQLLEKYQVEISPSFHSLVSNLDVNWEEYLGKLSGPEEETL